MARRQPTPIPGWAHAVEIIDGVWRCTGRSQRLDGEPCGFRSTAMSEAIEHATSNQYDWRHAEPVDVTAA